MVSKQIQSPLTAFNAREKKYKRSLSGTYGKNYLEKAEAALKPDNNKDFLNDQDLEDAREMKECLRDLNMSKTSEIPDTYLYQPSNMIRLWMEKRGKKRQKYMDNEQVDQMKKYFMQLDTDGSGAIGPAEIEETLISLGLARTREDVLTVVEEMDEDCSGELDFEEFLTMLKDMTMKNSKTNYLTDRNLLFEKQTLANAEFTRLKKQRGELFPPLSQEQKHEVF